MGVPVSAPPPTYPIREYPAPSHKAGDLFENSSRSSSESTGVIKQESGNYNSQVNINHNSHIGYGPGESHPVPVFTGTMRFNPNYGDYEAIVGISVPIGNRSTKASRERLIASKRAIEIENRFRTMSGCYNIHKTGMYINYELLQDDDDPLWECQTLIAGGVIELPPPPVRDIKPEVEEYKKAIQKQQVLIQKLLKRIDQMEQENGSPFKPPG